jgi:hypothetical protein
LFALIVVPGFNSETAGLADALGVGDAATCARNSIGAATSTAAAIERSATRSINRIFAGFT